MIRIGVLAVLLCVCSCGGKDSRYRAVYLTDDIEKGLIGKAQKRAEATPLLGNIRSYAGYFTVDKARESNMFFWYFPTFETTVPREQVPVILWLNGGPGASSLFGALGYLSPYLLNKNGTVQYNKNTWADFAHLLFIDNPVGVGFSFTRSSDGYSTTQTQVGQNLYLALVQFFQLFPHLQKNPLIICGASYAGKYLPSLGITIHKNNPTADLKLNLQGISIGNGWVDPINMLDFGDMLYYTGMLDTNGRKEFNKRRDQVKALIKRNEYRKAYDIYDPWILGDTTPYPTLYNNLTGLYTYFNYMKVGQRKVGVGKQWIFDFFNKNRNAWKLNAGKNLFDRPIIVAESLREDILRSVVGWLAVLMENYRVLIYNGMLDIKCGYPLTENFLNKMKWNGAEEYKKAARHHWFVNGKLAGYWKTAGNFTQVLVRNAGHTVPKDKPESARNLLYTFAYNRPFGENRRNKRNKKTRKGRENCMNYIFSGYVETIHDSKPLRHSQGKFLRQLLT